ncbi:hypothetical protein E2C01_013382 [Portunus trituberculatus]|uniref:Uncharacterized protein n=1 Tax=Portunus trituberculatus TaxID=210409 RepID=A0A5B7DGX9_PORTR|nr:hypothetical protein [Portunus trituberculatus]
MEKVNVKCCVIQTGRVGHFVDMAEVVMAVKIVHSKSVRKVVLGGTEDKDDVLVKDNTKIGY